jgi:hypothetical protein
LLYIASITGLAGYYVTLYTELNSNLQDMCFCCYLELHSSEEAHAASIQSYMINLRPVRLLLYTVDLHVNLEARTVLHVYDSLEFRAACNHEVQA